MTMSAFQARQDPERARREMRDAIEATERAIARRDAEFGDTRIPAAPAPARTAKRDDLAAIDSALRHLAGEGRFGPQAQLEVQAARAAEATEAARLKAHSDAETAWQRPAEPIVVEEAHEAAARTDAGPVDSDAAREAMMTRNADAWRSR